ncbi:MAG: hypothetical protein O9302_07000 [Cyclobacteriaceae bacterium]|nr:hypothetical protein [Cytophagales bacterium]MCZ8327788.1 hypothetical protein [Cyclobacteriaceae bacterium]
MDLKVNQVFKTKDSENSFRILFINQTDNYVYVFECKEKISDCKMPTRYLLDETILKFNGGEFYLVDDEFIEDRDWKTLSDKERDKASKAYLLIKDIVENTDCYCKEFRWAKIKRKKKYASKKAIFNYLKKYWRNGMSEMALVPEFKNCGAPSVKRASRATKEVEQKIKSCYKKHVIESGYKTKVAFSHFINENPGCKNVISQHIFYRIGVSELTKAIRKIAKDGVRNFENNSQALTGRSIDGVLGPCHLYQIDSTKRDIKIISSYVKGWYIGRPTFYVVTDIWTRAIVGVLITLDKPSYIAAAHALLYSFTNKDILYKNLGLNAKEFGWSNCYLPNELVADKAELFGPKSDTIVKNLGISLGNTRAYRPYQKGNVEKLIDTIQERVVHLFKGKGQVDKKDDTKTAKDSSLEATITLRDLMEITFRTTDEYNNYHWIDKYPLTEEMIEDRVRPIPAELHKWGIMKGYGVEKVIPNRNLWLKLLDSKKVTPNKEGFRINGYDYVVKDEKYRELFQEVISGKILKQEIKFDPRNYKNIFWNYENEFIELRLRGKKDCEFDNIWSLKAVQENYNQLRKEHLDIELQVNVKNDNHFKSIINERVSSRKIEVKNTRAANYIEKKMEHEELGLFPNEIKSENEEIRINEIKPNLSSLDSMRLKSRDSIKQYNS